MDWTWIDTLLVPIARFVIGPVIQRLPDAGWFKNKFIPKWIMLVAFVVALGEALVKINQAAGLSSLFVSDTVSLAGFFSLNNLYVLILVPLIKAWATMVLSRVHYEAGKYEKASS